MLRLIIWLVPDQRSAILPDMTEAEKEASARKDPSRWREAKWILITLAAALLLCALPVLLLFLVERDSHRRHAGQIRQAHAEWLVPAQAWVRTFSATHQRLPTDAELRAPDAQKTWPLDRVGISAERPVWQQEWGAPGRDFMIGTSVGEWNLSLCSWDQRLLEVYNE